MVDGGWISECGDVEMWRCGAGKGLSCVRVCVCLHLYVSREWRDGGRGEVGK